MQQYIYTVDLGTSIVLTQSTCAFYFLGGNNHVGPRFLLALSTPQRYWQRDFAGIEAFDNLLLLGIKVWEVLRGAKASTSWIFCFGIAPVSACSVPEKSPTPPRIREVDPLPWFCRNIRHELQF